jgi:hypothetical protein
LDFPFSAKRRDVPRLFPSISLYAAHQANFSLQDINKYLYIYINLGAQMNDEQGKPCWFC